MEHRSGEDVSFVYLYEVRNLFIIISLIFIAFDSYGQESSDNCSCKKLSKEFKYFEESVRINKYPFFPPKKPVTFYADGTHSNPKINKHISTMLKCIPEVELLNPSLQQTYSVYDKDLEGWEDWLSKNCKNEFEEVRLKIDNIIIYSLPQFSTYLINIDCDEIKNKEEVEVTNITDKEKIEKFISVFRYDNLVKDTIVRILDARLLIEYKVGDIIIKSICWSPVGRIKYEGAKPIYLYNKRVEDFLLEEKLIIKIEY